jgi:hypothetical protein
VFTRNETDGLIEKEIQKMTVVADWWHSLLGDEGNEATDSFLGTKA